RAFTRFCYKKLKGTQRLKKLETFNRIPPHALRYNRMSFHRDHTFARRGDRCCCALKGFQFTALNVELNRDVASTDVHTVNCNHVYWTITWDKKTSMVGSIVFGPLKASTAVEITDGFGNHLGSYRKIGKVCF